MECGKKGSLPSWGERGRIKTDCGAGSSAGAAPGALADGLVSGWAAKAPNARQQHEIRNPKSEIRNKPESQEPQFTCWPSDRFSLRNSEFVRISDFEFWVSLVSGLIKRDRRVTLGWI